MGRPENPVDRTVPQRAALAQWLRQRRAACGVTYAQMAVSSKVSSATLKRAADGKRVPKLSVVKAYVLATTEVRAKDREARNRAFVELRHALNKAERLWKDARHATGPRRYTAPGHYRVPDPLLIGDLADLSRALRDLHATCGLPAPSQMEKAGSFGVLPRSTVRRVLQGRTVPATRDQLGAFLTACGVTDPDLVLQWTEAYSRARDAVPREPARDRVTAHTGRSPGPARTPAEPCRVSRRWPRVSKTHGHPALSGSFDRTEECQAAVACAGRIRHPRTP